MATVRHNLAPNPCVKTSSAGWYGPTGYQRITGAHSSLPRSTAFRGRTSGDVITARWDVTPGKWYRATMWVRSVNHNTVDTAIHWYDNAGAYIGYSYGDWYDLAGGTTTQLDTGSGKAPVGAASALMIAAGVDDTAQFTAVLAQEFASEAEADAADVSYFDGDSPGAVWDEGTNGTSTETTNVPLTVSFPLDPPVGLIGSVVSTGVFTLAIELPPPAGAIGLTAQISYDDVRGRVRIHVDGLAPGAIRARVSSRVAGTRRWTPIRGGKVAVAAGSFTRTVDHYEFAAGATMEYLVEALSTAEGEPDTIVQSRVLTAYPNMDQAWLKFIPAPHSNRKITLGEWDEFEREDRSAVYDVQGRRDPVVVTDLHRARTTTVRVYTETLPERDALDEALSQGAPIFLHTPVDALLPSMYAVVGRYRYGRTTKRGARHLFTIPLTEVAPPPLSVFGAGTTWQNVVDRFATWADLIDYYETWREVAD